jgi:hypothetical protein
MLTEIMPKQVSSGADFEDWIEVKILGSDFDLNGLIVENIKTSGGSVRSWTIEGSSCIRFATGNYVVLGGANAILPDGISLSGLFGGANATSNTLIWDNEATLSIQLDDEANTVLGSVVSYTSPNYADAYSYDETAQTWCYREDASSPGTANPACE